MEIFTQKLIGRPILVDMSVHPRFMHGFWETSTNILAGTPFFAEIDNLIVKFMCMYKIRIVK